MSSVATRDAAVRAVGEPSAGTALGYCTRLLRHVWTNGSQSSSVSSLRELHLGRPARLGRDDERVVGRHAHAAAEAVLDADQLALEPAPRDRDGREEAGVARLGIPREHLEVGGVHDLALGVAVGEMVEEPRERRPAHVLALADADRLLAAQARAAVADAGAQEVRAEAVVEADALRDLDDVRAGRLADVRDLVDERDARHQERVRGELDHLGRVDVAAHDRRVERRVERGDGVAVARARTRRRRSRSGCMKSRTALPSARNSGFDA